MDQKKCLKCKVIRPLEEFCFKNKSKNKRSTQCNKCTRERIRNHYLQNKSYYKLKSKMRNKIVKDEIQSFLIAYLKSHPCVDCNETDIIVLEFDHKTDKYSDVSLLLKRRVSLYTIQKEVEKCEVRCANCHRKKTALAGNWYRTKD